MCAASFCKKYNKVGIVLVRKVNVLVVMLKMSAQVIGIEAAALSAAQEFGNVKNRQGLHRQIYIKCPKSTTTGVFHEPSRSIFCRIFVS